MSTEFKVLLGLELDSSSLSSIKNEIKRIGNDPVKIKIQPDISNINGIQNKVQSKLSKLNFTGASVNQAVRGSTNKEYFDTLKNSFSKDIERIQRQINFSGIDSKFGTNYASQISAISSELANATSERFKVLKTQFADLKKDLSFDTKKLSLINDIDEFSNKINELGKNSDLTALVNELKGLKGNIPNISSEFALDDAVSKFRELRTFSQDVMSNFATKSQRENLATKIESVIENNGLGFKYSNSGKELQSYIEQLRDANTAISKLDFTNISSKFSSVNQAVRGSTNIFSELATKAGSLFKYLNSLFLSQVAFDSVIRVFKEVSDVDKSMTELYRVTVRRARPE